MVRSTPLNKLEGDAFRNYSKYTSRSRRMRSGTSVQKILFCCQKS